MSEQPPLSQTANAEFTAGDVKEASGLSYRQLDDWDSKGALSSRREGKAGWRKFTPRDVFALMVCGEIRQQFGVPVQSLRWVKDFMLQEKANHFRYAVETISTYGFAIWLLTDLRETFIMDTELEMDDLIRLGFLRNEDSKSFILLQINPLVNRLLACHKPPIKLKIHDETYSKLRAFSKEDRVSSVEEREVLRLVRQKAYQRVTVHMRDGRIIQADMEEDLSKSDAAKRDEQILQAIKNKDFATVTVHRADGKTVGILRKSTMKFDKVTGKT